MAWIKGSCWPFADFSTWSLTLSLIHSHIGPSTLTATLRKPNAIAIRTLHARQTLRSLLSREATHDLLIGLWKINHLSLKSSLNGVRVEGGTGDRTEKVDPSGSVEASEDSDDEEEIYDEDRRR